MNKVIDKSRTLIRVIFCLCDSTDLTNLNRNVVTHNVYDWLYEGGHALIFAEGSKIGTHSCHEF